MARPFEAVVLAAPSASRYVFSSAEEVRESGEGASGLPGAWGGPKGPGGARGGWLRRQGGPSALRYS